MITNDQPIIFGKTIIAAVSSRDDGNMAFGRGDNNEVCVNREIFLAQVGIDTAQTTLLQVSYTDTTNFTRYQVVGDEQMGEGMLGLGLGTATDGMVVTRPGHAILLPLADCAGAIIFDSLNQIMMVSHLGRHSVEAGGGMKSIQYLIQEFDSDPTGLLVWLSPSVGADTYPLYHFYNRGLQEVIIEQLLSVGVRLEHIEASLVDTAVSEEYFSHSEFLAGNRSEDYRFSIVAMLQD